MAMTEKFLSDIRKVKNRRKLMWPCIPIIIAAISTYFIKETIVNKVIISAIYLFFIIILSMNIYKLMTGDDENYDKDMKKLDEAIRELDK